MNKFIKKGNFGPISVIILIVIIGFFSLGLSGCGGGGYSNYSNSSSSPLSISGKVLDGPVSGATITIYQVTPAGFIVAGSGSTGANGSFSLNISGYNSSDYYILYVTGGTFSNNGSNTPAPTMIGFLVPGGSPTVYISPLTTLIGEMLFNSNGTLNTSLNSVQVDSYLQQMFSIISQIFNGISENTLNGISSSDPSQVALFQELLTLLHDLANTTAAQTGEAYNQAMLDLLSYISNPNNNAGKELEAAIAPGGNGNYYFMNFTFTGNGGGEININGTLDNGDQTGLGNIETTPPLPAGVNNIPATFSLPTNFSVWILNGPAGYGSAETVTKLDSSGNTVGTYNVGPGADSIAIDSSGNIWVAGYGVVTELSQTGTIENTCYLDTGSTTGNNPNYNDSNYISVDSSNHVWVTSDLGFTYTQQSIGQDVIYNNGYNEEGYVSSKIYNSWHGAILELNYVNGQPCAVGQNIDIEQKTNGIAWGAGPISIDPSGNIWVIAGANAANRYASDVLAEFNSGGVLITPSPFTTGSDYMLNAISIDSSGNVWGAQTEYPETTGSSSFVSENGNISNAAIAAQNGFNTVAVDPSDNIWVTGDGSADIFKYNLSGAQLNEYNMGKTIAGFEISFTDVAQGKMAFDPAGNVWVTGTGSNGIAGAVVINPKTGSQAFYKASNPIAIAIEAYPAPTVISSAPSSSETNVSTSSTVSATFSEAMDSSTINSATFTVNDTSGTSVSGTVAYNSTNDTATFTPSSSLNTGTTYTADITTGAESSNGTAIANNYSWSFTTASAPAGGSNTFTVGTNPTGIAIDSSGNIWVANYGSSSVTEISPLGAAINTFTSNINNPRSIAIDSSGNVWVTNFGSTTITELLKSSNYSSQTFSIGIPEPDSIAIDASGNVWVTDAYGGYDNVFELLSPAYVTNNSFAVGSGGGIVTGIAIDANQNVWVGYDAYGYGSITELLNPGYAVPGTIYNTSLTTSPDPTGIAIDSSSNVWITNSGSQTYDNIVAELTAPSYASYNTYNIGTSQEGIAIDANQNVWVANYGNGTVTELNSSGAVIKTYSVGKEPTGIAIDKFGNVWVSNFGDGTLTELTGVAAGPQFFPYTSPQWP